VLSLAWVTPVKMEEPALIKDFPETTYVGARKATAGKIAKVSFP